MIKKIVVFYHSFMNQTRKDIFLNIGLLFLRLALGLMMALGHGWGKLLAFAEKSSTFANPVGLGSSTSMALAVFAEFFCSIALILGVATRFILIPLIITLFVAAFVVHGDDPWSRKEFAVLYLVPFIFLFLSGAGRFSIDGYIRNKIDNS